MIEQLQECQPRDFMGAPNAPSKIAFRTSATTETEVKNWLSAMMTCSQCTYRVRRTYKPTMKRVKYKVDLICQHKRKPLTKQQLATRSSHSSHHTLVHGIRKKKTDCPSTMTIVLQNPTKKVLRTSSSPDDICSHATKIKLDFDHNHPICGAHFLSFCPIKEETKEQFFNYLTKGILQQLHSTLTSQGYCKHNLLATPRRQIWQTEPSTRHVKMSVACTVTGEEVKWDLKMVN